MTGFDISSEASRALRRMARLTTRWFLCMGLSVMSPFFAGCGNGESPAQSATTLLAKARALAKEMGSGNPVAQSVPRSGSEGSLIAFESAESNVVENDMNRVTDVFVYDRQAKRTTRVSINSGGAQANAGSFLPQLSHDGRYVVFESLASNLVPDDTNRQRDVFVHDLRTQETRRVSVNSAGEQANNFSQAAHVSRDGRYVVFESLASNLVPGDTNGVIDVFVHDRQTQHTTRVSVATGGSQANNTSVNPTVSGDGRFVTFESFATNLTPEQTDGQKQTFIHDRETGKTVRAPNHSAADSAAGPPTPALIPADGQRRVCRGSALNHSRIRSFSFGIDSQPSGPSVAATGLTFLSSSAQCTESATAL
jgi:archaellum component FlaF (FlaF/FlaG flagellin family)